MSRHRNVRNLIAEDYDDYDDDYDDNYDDYDDYAAAAPKKKKAPVAPKKAAPAAAAKAPLKKKNVVATSASGSAAAPATTVSAATALLKSPAAAAAAAPPPTTAVLPPTSKPPPGFASSAPAPSSSGRTLTPPKQQQQQQQSAPNSASAATPASAVATVGPPVPPVLEQESTDNQNRTKNQKQNLTLVILGHVDAGKSTVTGHLLYSAGSSSGSGGGGKNTGASPYRGRKPQNYAWLLDEDEQERAHGITMDIATKTLTTQRFRVVLQDAPGHADYVPSAITGTSNAQAALLVVDATDSRTALESGQFRQHAYLARGLGVMQVLVVINKMDLTKWNRDTYEAISNSATQILVQAVGYPAVAVRCVPVSGLIGTNIVDKKGGSGDGDEGDEDTKLLRSWYKGPTLVEAIDGFFDKQRGSELKSNAGLLEKPLRLVLTDVVGEQGKATRTAARAKVLQGWVKCGETLCVLPLADEVVVQKLSSLHGSNEASSSSLEGTTGGSSHGNSNSNSNERSQYAGAGEMIDLVLTGVDASRILVGNTLCRPDVASRPPLATRCRAKIWVLEGLTVPVIRGAQAVFYMHQLNVPCYLSKLERTFQKDGKTVLRERPRAIGSNTQAVVEITLSNPIVMESFDACRALGRFVLRRGGDSIAVGRIEHVYQ